MWSEWRIVRGTPSGALIHANMAMAENLRWVTVWPKNTRAGWLRMRTSMPRRFHWLCRTCWTSSRLRLPAVVMISRVRGSPAVLRRTPLPVAVHPAASNRAAALAGSWGYLGMSSAYTQSRGLTLLWATGWRPAKSFSLIASRSRA